mmetsp:Transcript_62820/g.175037  ORF Transcript_62820/g.175037 Transcript_62820/m.175037 type:complete len:85 (+) Transcript_62820:1690-1944(+)
MTIVFIVDMCVVTASIATLVHYTHGPGGLGAVAKLRWRRVLCARSSTSCDREIGSDDPEGVHGECLRLTTRAWNDSDGRNGGVK